MSRDWCIGARFNFGERGDRMHGFLVDLMGDKDICPCSTGLPCPLLPPPDERHYGFHDAVDLLPIRDLR